TFRCAELGFFGVRTPVHVTTPRNCGRPSRARFFFLGNCFRRGPRTSWLIVGTRFLSLGLTKCPRQESNLVHDLRGVGCDPAHPEDSAVSRPGFEPRSEV